MSISPFFAKLHTQFANFVLWCVHIRLLLSAWLCSRHGFVLVSYWRNMRKYIATNNAFYIDSRCSIPEQSVCIFNFQFSWFFATELNETVVVDIGVYVCFLLCSFLFFALFLHTVHGKVRELVCKCPPHGDVYCTIVILICVYWNCSGVRAFHVGGIRCIKVYRIYLIRFHLSYSKGKFGEINSNRKYCMNNSLGIQSFDFRVNQLNDMIEDFLKGK